MSLGLGVFLSTLVVSLLLLYRWTKDRWNWRKGLKVSGVFAGGISVVVGGGMWLYVSYENRAVPQTSYYDVSLGMTKDEVRYVRGIPTAVYEPVSDDPKLKGANLVIETQKLKEGKSIEQYDEWGYSNDRSRVDIAFSSKTHKVVQVSCYAGENGNCESILGIYRGSSEELLRKRLGKPDSEQLSGVTKRVLYKDLNLSFFLEKRRCTC